MKTFAQQKSTYPTHVRIPHIEALKSELEHGDPQDFFINLGSIRSSKSIQMLEGKRGVRFVILNEVDGTRQTLSEKQIMDERLTNIGAAMVRGNFYAY